MKLSKYEKETIILTNEEDRYYSVYTFNQGLQKRLTAPMGLSSKVCKFF